MSIDPSSDLGFFATGRRQKISPENNIEVKIETKAQDLIPEEKIRLEFEYNQKIKNLEMEFKNLTLKKEEEIKKREELLILKERDEKSQAQTIDNIGTELQKFRRYPAKIYDVLKRKTVTLSDDDYLVIRELATDISIARRKSKIPNKETLPRITESTIIRSAMRAVCQKIENSKTDLTSLQTEESLVKFFESMMK
jgi:hypothetical protein